MNFTEYCKAVAEGTLELNEEQQRRYVHLAEKITDKLKPDTVIGKGSEFEKFMDEIKKE